MTELPAHVEQALADLSAEDFAALVARTRQPEEQVTDPKEKAVRALRRHRGLDRTGRASKEQAADALRRMRNAD